MKKNLKVLSTSVLGLAALVFGATSLSSCGSSKETILIWGPTDHEQIYKDAFASYVAANPDFDVNMEFAGSGDSGAYSAMSVDPQTGAAVYTYVNDMLINLNRVGALDPLSSEDVTWISENNTAGSVSSGKIGDKYYGYPITDDNGYFMYFNKDAFVGTSVWDSTKNSLKDGYTFQDLYNALDERALVSGKDKWANGAVTWAIGDSWYDSGVFFATGGDYSVTYDNKGAQTSVDCTFGYTQDDNGNRDYTVGLEAVAAMKNTFMTDGELNKHYYYTDGATTKLNDFITTFATAADKPLAAAICGTWKAKEITQAWGDDAGATILPTLVGRNGDKYQMKTFAGYKLIGVNPLCSYAAKSDENLDRLHDFAKYLSDYDIQVARYESTGAGPSNKQALSTNEEIVNDYALQALAAQYAYDGNKGFRIQESVPSNYWTPIQTFGQTLYNDITTGATGNFDTESNIKRQLAQLQYDIISAAQ